MVKHQTLRLSYKVSATKVLKIYGDSFKQVLTFDFVTKWKND